MIFMALVGGLGTFEGADPRRRRLLRHRGVVRREPASGISSGSARRRSSSRSPCRAALWGWVEDRTALRLLPVGYRVQFLGVIAARSTAPRVGKAERAVRRETPRRKRARARDGRTGMLLGKTIVVTGISSGIGARVGELALALGADVIGVDVNAPAAPLGAFVKADISPRRRRSPISPRAAEPHRRAVQRRRRFRRVGRASRRWRSTSTACARSARLGAAAARRRRGRQRRLDRRLRLARQSRTRQGPRRRARLSRHRRAAQPLSTCPTAKAIRCRKSFCCCGRCGPPISRCSSERGVRVNAVSPGAGDDADPQGVPPDFRRSARRRRHRAGRPRRRARRTSLRRRCSCARTARAGSTAPICRSTAASRLRSTRASSAFEAEPGNSCAREARDLRREETT